MIVLNSPARGSSILVVVTITTLLAACSGSMDQHAAAAEPPSTQSAMGDQSSKMPPQRAPGEERTPAHAQGEVPQQLLAIFQDDLTRRARVKHDAITVVSATEQQWPDSAMGCPQPGMMYSQMIVPGYRVVLQASGNRYAYHSDRGGNFIVCSNGLAFKPVKEAARGEPPAE